MGSSGSNSASPFGAPTPDGPSKPGAALHAMVSSQSTCAPEELELGLPHADSAAVAVSVAAFGHVVQRRALAEVPV